MAWGGFDDATLPHAALDHAGETSMMGMRTRTIVPEAREEGASAIEYAFLVSLIALVIILSVEAVGISLFGVFTDVLNAF